MKNFIESGDVLTIPAPAAVASGGVVVAGQLIGVAVSTAASGAAVAVQTRGVFDLPKAAALAIGLGAAVYWDATPGVVTTIATDNTLIGYATAAAPASAATLRVRIG